MNRIINEIEEDLGIIFPPSKKKLMLIIYLSLKYVFLSGLVILESDTKIIIPTESETIKTKKLMLTELREFVVKNNRIKVEYKDKPVEWKPFELSETKKEKIEALRFEKNELGEIIGM